MWRSDTWRRMSIRIMTRSQISQLSAQVLRLCQQAGLVKLGHVALDGTKANANASKHKTMSYDRMGEAEKKLQAEVKALLQEAARVDAEEDGKYGRETRGRVAGGAVDSHAQVIVAAEVTQDVHRRRSCGLARLGLAQLVDKNTEIEPNIHLITLVSDKPGTLELRELSLALKSM